MSGKGSFFMVVPMRFFFANAGLMKFPVHPESIKALAQENMATFTQTIKLSEYRALFAAILCGPGRSFQGLPSGGSPSFPHRVVAACGPSQAVVGGLAQLA